MGNGGDTLTSDLLYINLAMVVLLFVLPWLDRGPHYSPLKRPFATIIGLLVIATVVLNMLMAVSRIINFPGGE